MRQLETSTSGLTSEEAARRLEAEGPNEIATHKEPSWPIRLAHTFRNPLVILLAVLALTSALTGDSRAAVVMLLMIFLGVGLRFAQETRAGAAAAKLRERIGPDRGTYGHTIHRKIREFPARKVDLSCPDC